MAVFTVPTNDNFDAQTHAANAVIRLNQRIDALVDGFVQDYEDFWGVSGSDQTQEVDGEQVTVYVPAGSKYTVEQMQAKIDSMGIQNAGGLLMLAANLRDLIVGAQTVLGVDLLPARYHSPAFTLQAITSASAPIVITGLSATWTPPEREE
jgi:hypothetical protein